MKSKIAKFLKFFEVFGLYYEDHKSSKCALNFIISRFAHVFWFLISIFLILLSIYRGLTTNHFSKLDYFLQYFAYFFIQIGGFVIQVLAYKLRDKEQEILKYLTEVDELIEKDIEIKINFDRYKREALKKILMQLLLTIVTMIFRYMFDSHIYMYKSHEQSIPDLAVFLGRIFFLKFIFYVDLMNFQMRVRNL